MEIEQTKVTVPPDGRISRRDAAVLMGRSAKTLADWTWKGWGPRPIVVAGRVFHDLSECLEMARGEKPIVPELA